MAYSQNGQNYYGHQRNAHQSSSAQQASYSPSPRGQDQYVRRTSSFDTGDDALLHDEDDGGANHVPGHGGYGWGVGDYPSGGGASIQPDELFMGIPSPPLPNRTATYGLALSGYQQQRPPPNSPPLQSTYNPQQFARTQSQQYNPSAYSRASQVYGSNQQPYNPADYTASNTPRHSTYAGPAPTTYTTPTSYTAPIQPPRLPPLPPRSQQGGSGGWTGSQYDSIASQHSGYQTYSPNRYSSPIIQAPGSAPLPPRPSTFAPPTPTAAAFPPAAGSRPMDDMRTVQPRPLSQNLTHSNSQHVQMPHNQSSPHHRLPSLPDYHSYTSQSSPSRRVSRTSTSSHNSPGASLPPTPGPLPPQHSPRRMDTVGRHPQLRPLPGPPPDPDYFIDNNGDSNTHSRTEEELRYEELMKEIEDAYMDTSSSSTAPRRSPRAERISHQSPIHEEDEPTALFSAAGRTSVSPNTERVHTNGHVSATGTGQYVNYDAYSDESDAEAAAGLAAMQMAEEQEAADEARRESGGGPLFGTFGSQQTAPTADSSTAELSSDSDIHVDMDLYGGGYEGHMAYGDVPTSQHSSQGNTSEMEDQSRPLPTPGSWRRSEMSAEAMMAGGDLYDYLIPDQDDIHPFPSFGAGARVDTFGTGGLAEPSPHRRRLSFDDGDEANLVESELSQRSGSQSPAKQDLPEMFYHPGLSSQRPLPPAPGRPLTNNRIPQLMPAGTYQRNAQSQQVDQFGRPVYPAAPDSYAQTLLSPSGAPVPRSSSLSSHSNTPQTVPPIRSKTDAEERRAKLVKQAIRTGMSPSDLGYDSATPQSSITLDLPAIPAGKRKKYNPAKLSTSEFKKCTEPWALSSIVTWMKDMTEDETDLKEHAIVDGIVALFTHKVPTMNTADAETLGARIVRDMFDAGTLIKEEEWVRFSGESMSGVLFQITGTGCYAPRLHTHTTPPHTTPPRCYSYHCMRTLKKINLQTQILEPQRKAEDWITFYKVDKDSLEGVNKKEIERQNNLHEIVTSEDFFMDQLNVLRILYRDELQKWQPPIITPKRIDAFIKDVFGKVDAIKKVNEDFLLAQLKYRQQEQGPWVVGFADIFREWIRKAKGPYIEYAASFPNATATVRKEAERNILFRQFLDQMQDNERSKRLGWDTYLKAPITRLQRYGLLLSTVHKNMVQDTEEKHNLQVAIEEIKVVTLECDARVAEMSKKTDLAELATKLVLRANMVGVELNLTHLGRELIFQGDLQRLGDRRFNWLDTHAILFDHYLVLAKASSQRDAAGGLKYEKYDVSKLPIPMDLLVLENTNDDPVVKSSMKGISVTTVTPKVQTPQESRLGRTISNQNGTGPGTLTHTNTNTSVTSVSTTASGRIMVPNTTLEGGKDEKVLYPFRIKHLGKSEVYTLYAPTAQNRQDWCEKILEAKTRHAASLFMQNAEPLRLRVLADTAFAYDTMSGGAKQVVIRGTPLDRAVRKVAELYNSLERPLPICRAVVNCATTFMQPYGKQMVAVGTDYGVFISDYENPRGWSRAISQTRVTQIAVLEEFSLFLLIADKSLIAYHLDAVCPVNGHQPQNDSARRAPQKLSGNRDVGFFATGRMKDRTLVFYKKREGASSIFKVLEPVYQKSTEKRSRFTSSLSRRGTTEFFRDFDDFYIPTDTYTLNLFHSSLAISTARGIEVLTLDKKLPLSIPDTKAPHVSTIAARIKELKPLGMFRLSDSEFLLAYEECAVYVNKHGDVSRGVIMEFVGKAKAATVYGPYILLFDSDFVEVRNAQNGRLRQVIAGRDVKCLDDGLGGNGNNAGIANTYGGEARGRTVKISLQHPEHERTQLVVELVINEGQKD